MPPRTPPHNTSEPHSDLMAVAVAIRPRATAAAEATWASLSLRRRLNRSTAPPSVELLYGAVEVGHALVQRDLAAGVALAGFQLALDGGFDGVDEDAAQPGQ